MELYHLKIYIDDLLHRAVGPGIGIQQHVGPSNFAHLTFLTAFSKLFMVIQPL